MKDKKCVVVLLMCTLPKDVMSTWATCYIYLLTCAQEFSSIIDANLWAFRLSNHRLCLYERTFVYKPISALLNNFPFYLPHMGFALFSIDSLSRICRASIVAATISYLPKPKTQLD